MTRRFVIVRVPGSGPPALAGAPNVFDTHDAAAARVAEIEAGHLKAHHTHLEIHAVEGNVPEALAAKGILI